MKITKTLFLTLLFFSCLSHAKFTPEDIAKDIIYREAKLSPDGTKLAVAMSNNSSRQLAILDMKDFSVLGGVNLGQRGEVGQYFWGNNERLILEVWRRQPWETEASNYGELYAINYDGSNGELIYGFTISERKGSNIQRKKAIDGWAQIISLLPQDERNILISSTPMSEGNNRFASVHKLDIYSGSLGHKIARAPAQQATFFTDKPGNLVMSVGTDVTGDTKVYRYIDEDWKEVSDDFGEGFQLVSLNDDASEAIFLDNKGQDKIGLFRMELKTGKRKEIYTDEVVSLTRSSINLTTDHTAAYAIRVDDGRPGYLVFSGAGEEASLFKDLLAALPGYTLALESRSKDGKKWILFAYNDIDVGTYYLFDKDKGNLSQLVANMSHISIDDLSEKQPFSFTATDGMTVHGYVTYPVDMKEGDKVPLVTLIHGGPHGVRDYWGFDRDVQMLAGQGYAVVQVNYRGSGGYGGDYQYKGYRHWGDTVQQDIIDGTDYIIEQGKIDKDKVCAMGSSFGGYSAMMSAELAPETFHCAVAMAGVYDLNLMREEGDIPDMLWGTSYLNKAIGQDAEELARFSPVNHVDKLSGAVLIAHGERDKRVPFEHAERLREAMDKAGKQYEWMVWDAEPHGLFYEENRIDFYNKVAEFLNKQFN